MNTARQISDAVCKALQDRNWKRAQSLLEQGIATLATKPENVYDPFEDRSPLTVLGLETMVVNLLERDGILTVGDLRAAIERGRLHQIDRIGVKHVLRITSAARRYRPPNR